MQYAILCSSFPVSVGVSVSSRSVCSASSLLFRQKFRYSSSISHFLRMKYNPSFFVFPFCSISLAHAGEIFCNFFCCFFRLPRMEYFFLRFHCPYQARPAEAPDVCISPDRFRNTVAHSDRPPEFRRGNVRTAPAAWRFRWMLPCEYSDHIFPCSPQAEGVHTDFQK